MWLERKRRLRPATERTDRRVVRNLGIAGLSAVAVQLAERPVILPVARWVERRRRGLLFALEGRAFGRRLRAAMALILLDYTLYLWHVLEHRSQLLYRFHIVHHADLDLDASTAVRFHFGELLASIPWRAAQVIVLGITPRELSMWQRWLLASILFHHSNIRLPLAVERVLSRVIMTPRLHGIHHSIVAEEQSSNWSSGLAIWDFLHGTYRANVPQDAIEIGVPAFREPSQVSFARSIAHPFGPQPAWTYPDGRVPVRSALPHSTITLET